MVNCTGICGGSKSPVLTIPRALAAVGLQKTKQPVFLSTVSFFLSFFVLTFLMRCLSKLYMVCIEGFLGKQLNSLSMLLSSRFMQKSLPIA